MLLSYVFYCASYVHSYFRQTLPQLAIPDLLCVCICLRKDLSIHTEASNFPQREETRITRWAGIAANAAANRTSHLGAVGRVGRSQMSRCGCRD